MSFSENISLEFELATKNLNGEKAGALFATRKAALSAFEKLGIPGLRHEEWRHTNIKTKLPESLSVTGKGIAVSKHQINLFPNIKATKLVFINGLFAPEISTIIEEKGVVAGSLKYHLSQNKELAEKYFGKLVQKYEEHFSSLNTAFALDGAFVHIANGVKANVPIFIIHVYNSPESFVQSRDLIIAGQSSGVQIAIDFQNAGETSYYNHVSEVFCGDNSAVDITKMQVGTKGSTAIHTMEAETGRDTKFSCTTVSLEGNFIRNNTNVRLSGENGEAHLNGLYYACNNALLDNHILIDHTVPNCESNQLYKGILEDEATGIFNGKIFVKPDAQKTNAFQSSKAILLSENAAVYSKPQLEIFADDVKCSHGAAIGQLNADEIFYLRARGIEEKDARALLTFAFAGQILEKVANKELRESLFEGLKFRLNLML